jgi:hypothetical protein
MPRSTSEDSMSTSAPPSTLFDGRASSVTTTYSDAGEGGRRAPRSVFRQSSASGRSSPANSEEGRGSVGESPQSSFRNLADSSATLRLQSEIEHLTSIVKLIAEKQDIELPPRPVGGCGNGGDDSSSFWGMAMDTASAGSGGAAESISQGCGASKEAAVGRVLFEGVPLPNEEHAPSSSLARQRWHKASRHYLHKKCRFATATTESSLSPAPVRSNASTARTVPASPTLSSPAVPASHPVPAKSFTEQVQALGNSSGATRGTATGTPTPLQVDALVGEGGKPLFRL